jgi:hypothetical protein
MSYRTWLFGLIIIGLLTLPILLYPIKELNDTVTPLANEVYEEDFTTYYYKDYVSDASWNIWEGEITVALQDQLDIVPDSVDVATDRFGGAYVVWEDAQGAYTFQRIDSQGNPLWEESRVSLESSYYRVRVTSYSNGDALLVWGESSSTYAQRYTPEGVPVWAAPSYIPEISGPSDVSVNSSEQAVIVWRYYDLNYM